MKLSICMMVKNEENNLKRCLDSLKNIRNSIESELIIIDTGSEDQTVDIAKLYTDQVYIHPWNNDFSEMRNLSMSYAKGDWLFLIDADEEVIDDFGIINFIKSTKSKKINGASILLKNIRNLSYDEFSSELITIRLLRNNINAHYEGKVHNRLKLSGLVIQIKGILHHYGYIIEDKVLMQKKFERTTSLLLNELSKTPDDVYYLYQLSSSYGMYGDWENCYIYSKQAYELIKNDKQKLKSAPYVISSLAKSLFVLKKFDEMIDLSLIGIELENDFIDLYFYMGGAYGSLMKTEKSIEMYETYLTCLARFDNSEFRFNPSIQHYSLNAEKEAYCNLVILYNVQHNDVEVIKYFDLLTKSSNQNNFYIDETIQIYIKATIKQGRSNLLPSLFELPFYKWYEISKIIDRLIIDCDKNQKIDIWLQLSNIDNPYGTLNKLRCGLIELNNISSSIFDSLNECLRNLYNDSLYFCIKLNTSFQAIFLKLPEEDLMELMGKEDENHSDFYKNVLSYLENYENEETFTSNNLKRILNKYVFIKNIRESDDVIYFEEYISSAIRVLSTKYTQEYLNLKIFDKACSAEEKYVWLVSLIVKEKDIELLDIANSIFEDWKPSLLRWLNWKLDTGKNYTDELNKLKFEMIDRITFLIKVGYKQEALELVTSIETIMPNDFDIILIKSKIFLN